MAIGIKTFQHTCINWSTLSLGKVHLNHIIRNIRKITLLINQKRPQPAESNIPCIGLCQPPRNPATAKPLTTNIYAYSLRKNTAQRNPEYSVIQPATNSDSASGISKGVRFVSAIALIKKMKDQAIEHAMNLAESQADAMQSGVVEWLRSDEFEIKCQTNGNINGANIGQEAPDFELSIIANGNGTFQLSDYQDQIVVLAFFAPG